jgi:hypothetical protein
MNFEDEVLDIDELDKQSERKCVVEYNNHRFGIKYRPELFGPKTMIVFEDLRLLGERYKEVKRAAERLQMRADEIVVRDGLDPEVALEKAKRINTDLVAKIEAEQNVDLRGTAAELARLISYIGLKAGGVFINPTEAFFLGRRWQFHWTLFNAITSDINRPTSEEPEASNTTSADSSSAVEKKDDAQSDTLLAEQQGGEIAASTNN